jgi:hypothetical protein
VSDGGLVRRDGKATHHGDFVWGEDKQPVNKFDYIFFSANSTRGDASPPPSERLSMNRPESLLRARGPCWFRNH